MANDLIVIDEGKNLTSLYTEKSIDKTLEEIKVFARSVVAGDVKTKAGAAGVRTMAARVRSTKVAMEKAGEELTDAIKKRAKDELDQIKPQIEKIGTELTALAEEIRKPLTEWETSEKTRTDKHEADLAVIANCLMIPAGMTSEQMQARIDGLEVLSGKEWEEYQEKAFALIAEKVPELKKHRETLKASEVMAAENARLKKEADDRAAEDRMRHAADMQAMRDAELLADAVNREHVLVAGAWQAAIVAKEKAEVAAKIAADKAAQDERDRQKSEQDQKEAADKTRAADEHHRLNVMNEAREDVIRQGGFFTEQADLLLQAITEGKIRHVAIKF